MTRRRSSAADVLDSAAKAVQAAADAVQNAARSQALSADALNASAQACAKMAEALDIQRGGLSRDVPTGFLVENGREDTREVESSK